MLANMRAQLKRTSLMLMFNLRFLYICAIDTHVNQERKHKYNNYKIPRYNLKKKFQTNQTTMTNLIMWFIYYFNRMTLYLPGWTR